MISILLIYQYPTIPYNWTQVKEYVIKEYLSSKQKNNNIQLDFKFNWIVLILYLLLIYNNKYMYNPKKLKFYYQIEMNKKES